MKKNVILNEVKNLSDVKFRSFGRTPANAGGYRSLRMTCLIIGLILAFVLILNYKLQIANHKSSPQEPVYTIACIDPGALKAPSPSRLREAIASVAQRHQTSVVVNKNLVISGVPEITDEVALAIRSGPSVPAESPRSTPDSIGFVNQQMVLNSPPVKQARQQYADTFLNLKLEFQKQSEHLSPEAKENLKAQYNTALAAYRQKLMGPLLAQLEKTIKRIAEQKGLACVVSSGDILYGGLDITRDVLNPGKSTESALLPAPPIAVVNPKKLIALHPFFQRLEELNREEESWKQGHYGIAETLLTSDEVSRWESARRHAMTSWEQTVQKLTASSGSKSVMARGTKPAEGNQEKELASIQSALKDAYASELRKKMDELNRTFQKHVGIAQKQTETALRAFADKLMQFRNAKVAATRHALSLEFEKRVKNHAAALQEEYLEFEKKTMTLNQPKKLDIQLKLDIAAPAEKKVLEDKLKALSTSEDDDKDKKRAALQRDLETYRDKELVTVAQALQKEASMLDDDAIGKIKKYKQEIIKASREALMNEQESLRAELTRYQGQALEKAKTSVARKVGKNSAFSASVGLARQGKALLEARLEGDRRQIEARLQQEEKDILSNSKSYQQIARSVKAGNRKIVSEVILGLEKEKAEILKTIQAEISRQAKTIAIKRGIPTILTEVAVNVKAADLTQAVAKEMGK